MRSLHLVPVLGTGRTPRLRPLFFIPIARHLHRVAILRRLVSALFTVTHASRPLVVNGS